MSITRRLFINGVAAVLSTINVPDVLALENETTPEADYEYEPFIEYLEVGEREEMLAGPATEAGWYLHPNCMMGCCHSEGPFPTKEGAIEADRAGWEKFRSASVKLLDPADIEPF